MVFYVGEERKFVGPEVDEAGNPIVRWIWDFGDGSTGEGQIVTHVYDTPGTYTIHLTTINSCGKQSDPDDPRCFQTITIQPSPSITGECIFPRIITGTLTPRLDTGKVFYRVRCIIDKWVR